MYKSIETYRGFVYPSAIDHVGHMNVQSYTARFDEASWQFLGKLGMSPLSMKEDDRGFAAVEQRTTYKHEIFSGALLHVTTELVEIRRSTVRMIHRMFDSETNTEVAASEIVAVYLDTVRRASVPLPESVMLKASDLALSYAGCE